MSCLPLKIVLPASGARGQARGELTVGLLCWNTTPAVPDSSADLHKILQCKKMDRNEKKADVVVDRGRGKYKLLTESLKMPERQW